MTWHHDRGPIWRFSSQGPTIPPVVQNAGYLRRMRRRCARPGCSETTTVTLSYDYKGATVWLEHLAAEGHPMTHDLCDRHAARTKPPRGWQLVDQRHMVEPLIFKAPIAS